MANPVPFQPPAHLKKMFEDADAALGDFLDDQRMQYFEHTLNKCGKASRCLNNLKPYFSQFCLIDEMYSMFPRFNTKMEKFKAAHAERLQAKFPAAVRRTMSSFEDLKKERTRALANAASKNHDARAQSGIEPESTKANEPKNRPDSHYQDTALSPESISSDSEDEADAVEAQVDEDTHMEDVHIDPSEYPVILPWKPEPTPEEVEAKKRMLKQVRAFVSGRPETVRIPYINISRLDQTSNNYTKAMAIVARTNPEEAQKVASSIVISSKRRRQNSFIELTDSTSQSEFLSIEDLDTSTPSTTVSTAIAIAESTVPRSNDALLLIEYNTRTELSAISHRISLFVDAYRNTYSEHQKCTAVLKEKGLTPLVKLADAK
ncbi:hypothetical protein B0H12DRAFT_1241132 [Mycena haematopus]|nr:hypothetical protein B0H12DRAFT_1241132 [Mycena haematopus]